MLFKNEMVIDDSNVSSIIGDGEKVVHNGETFYLSARPPAPGEVECCGATPFEQSGIKVYDRQELIDRIREQVKQKARNSDYQKYPPKNQARTNYCHMNGPCGAMATSRVRQGHPYREISAASAAAPMTRYRNVGGNEWPDVQWLMEHGATTTDVWPNAAIDRKYATPEADKQRPFFKPTEVIQLTGSKAQMFMQFMSGLVDGYTGAFAKYSMSHVMELADAVEIEPGELGYRQRNSWGDWGAKNDYGFAGYAVYRESFAPDSGLLIREVVASN